MSTSFIAAVAIRARDGDAGSHLTAADVEDRLAALETIGVLGQAQSHLPAIIACLDDEETAFGAASLLCSCAGAAALVPHVSAVLRQFEQVPSSARWHVVEALGKLEPAVLSAHAEDIARLLASVDADVRRRAVELMASCPASTLEAHVRSTRLEARPCRAAASTDRAMGSWRHRPRTCCACSTTKTRTRA